MAFLKALGLAFVAALVTGLALFGGFVFSVVSAIVTVLLAVAGIFTLVYYLLWESARNKKDE